MDKSVIAYKDKPVVFIVKIEKTLTLNQASDFSISKPLSTLQLD